MNLTTVEVQQYRSIKFAKVKLNPQCRILLGINESGKSNFLRALRLLDPNHKPSLTDIRYANANEDYVSDGWVDFCFRPTAAELLTIFEFVNSKVVRPSNQDQIIRAGKRRLTVDQACDEIAHSWYRVNLRSGKRTIVHDNLGEDYELDGRWCKLASPQEVTTTLKGMGELQVAPDALISHKSIPEESLSLFVDATVEDLETLIHSRTDDLLESSLPEVIWWTYDESHILPDRVLTQAFSDSPTTCIPLMRLFQLAGVDSITVSLTRAIKLGAHGLRNFLNNVATKATSHFNQVWPNYGQISFALDPNGDHIDISIKDAYNLYNFNQRSDGFKRFVTFLLMVSARSNNDLSGALILIDEPDIGLHPTGAKYLRDELLRLSESNYVLFSTHSIFMVDAQNVGRHLLVSKSDEITHLNSATTSVINDEEVLFRSLEYTVLENLKQKNILFEGWKDKRLFQLACGSPPRGKTRLVSKFSGYGLSHSQGVKNIPPISALFDFGSRELTIVTDCDHAAKDGQKRHLERRGHGTWHRYDQLVPNSRIQTSEDFIEESFLISVVNETCCSKLPSGSREFTLLDIANANGVITAMHTYLKELGLAGEEVKALVDGVKDTLFDTVSAAEIKSIYYDFIEALAAKI